ncbi:MAG: ACT domain-containing protein [Bdellovibrionales bacterium]|nr:ACT domain-containing protein [Bdellovibrionales bacterium]
MNDIYQHLKLTILLGEFKYVLLKNREQLIQLASEEAKPISLFSSSKEISAIIPAHIQIDVVKSEEDWSCVEIIGEMPFGTVPGLIATISSSLKTESLGLCVVSTFLTDWFFIRTKNLAKAKVILERDGWEFV